MIPVTPLLRHPAPWQKALQDSLCSAGELLAALDLEPADLGECGLEALAQAAARFAVRVPRSYLARMRRGDPGDPLLRQVLPLGAELVEAPGFVADPVGDLVSLTGPGLLHKYEGRALLVTTGSCAVNCRYCFRREFPYAEQTAGRQSFTESLAAIRADASIREVILSGGDPLTLGDRKLGGLVAALGDIPHVRRVRLHTRLPVVLPERIDAGFLRAWNAAPRLQRVVVLHANHANELRDAPDVAAALAALRHDGSTLLNQAVLLRGVNDTVAALAELGEALHEHGVLPYYLHVLDRVRGAAHFEVPEDEARRLVAALADVLPGYLVPKLVREVPGAGAKTMLPPASR